MFNRKHLEQRMQALEVGYGFIATELRKRGKLTSRGTVRNWVNGINEPPAGVLNALADVVRTKPERFLHADTETDRTAP